MVRGDNRDWWELWLICERIGCVNQCYDGMLGLGFLIFKFKLRISILG